MNKKVLIFTIKYDYSSNQVTDLLNFYGAKVVRINGDDKRFQFEGINTNGIIFKDCIKKETINLYDFDSIWWRRKGLKRHNFKFVIPDCSNFSMEKSFFLEKTESHINSEINVLIQYISDTLYKNAAVNLGNPEFDLNRLTVLDMAKRIGLRTPTFEIISNGRYLTASKKSLGKIVTKTIGNGIYDVFNGKRYYNYTETLDQSFYKENLDTVFCPSMISKLIEKQFEIRSFYLDGEFYSMAIFSQANEETKTDYRKADTPLQCPYKLPEEIEKKTRKLYQQLNLNTGSADFIVDKNGDYIFLEINPVGQFGMTSEPCNYNLEEKVAQFLINGTSQNN